jgi:hypothetical protein
MLPLSFSFAQSRFLGMKSSLDRKQNKDKGALTTDL